MADNQVAPAHTAPAHDAPAMDYAEHNRTFTLFAELMKWGSVFSIGLLLFIGAATGTVPWLFFLIVTAAMSVATAKFL